MFVYCNNKESCSNGQWFHLVLHCTFLYIFQLEELFEMTMAILSNTRLVLLFVIGVNVKCLCLVDFFCQDQHIHGAKKIWKNVQLLKRNKADSYMHFLSFSTSSTTENSGELSVSILRVCTGPSRSFNLSRWN